MIDIAAGCRGHVWHGQVSPEEPLGRAPTMLSAGERKMLHWLARSFPNSEGNVIVDAGCFLGGSTLALATGWAQGQSSRKNHRIHSYDMFIAPNDDYCLGLIGNNKHPGDTVLDLYAKYLELNPV